VKKQVPEEELIGYLLGSLEPAEERLVEEALKQNATIRQKLSDLEEKLAHLPDRFQEIDPPEGLSQKTLNTISIVNSSIKANDGRVQPLVVPAKKSAKKSTSSKDLQVGKGNWTAMDLVVGTVICFIVAVVLLPSIANSRFQTNLLHCQDNLRKIGTNMASIADSFDGEFIVPQNVDRWQASLFAQKIIETRLASEASEFICPNDPGKEKTTEVFQQAWSPVHLLTPESDFALSPSAERASQQPQVSSPPKFWSDLNLIRQSEAASGSYGFPAPQRTADGYQAIRVPGNRFTVLCADAACFDNPGYQSRNHGSQGQNILLGDLSVDYIRKTACLPSGDHIYTNNQGKIQPGVSPGDNLIFRGVIQIDNRQLNTNPKIN
jgi:hypothetical protein